MIAVKKIIARVIAIGHDNDILPKWILSTGFWDDTGIWIDAETWND